MDENSTSPTILVKNKGIIVSKDLSSNSVSLLDGFFESMGLNNLTYPLSQYNDTKDSFSELTRGSLKVRHIHRGNISCILTVKPPIMNVYGSLHGGAVGAIAERVAIACARTIVGKDSELFLGELNTSYLSGAPKNAEVLVNASIIRSGRNLSMVKVDFRLVDSEKLIYTSHATFYHMPVASL